MPMYRKPTEKELAKIKRAREKTVQGIEGEKDFLSKISTTSAWNLTPPTCTSN